MIDPALRIEGETPLSARSVYPGFFAALFLILLRIGIGWHFLYEGVYKIEKIGTKEPFSSEAYLRNATGPFAEFFRQSVPDVDAFDRLDLAKLEAHWKSENQRLVNHFGLNADQAGETEKVVASVVSKAKAWFEVSDNGMKVRQYRDELNKARSIETNPDSLWFQKENARQLRAKNEPIRRELVAVVEGWNQELKDSVVKLATDEQKTAKGEPNPPFWQMNSLERINNITIFGLTIVGFCMMAGLFTRPAILGGLGFLTLFYLSAPPFPGLPQSPMSEGHYLYVNKNLIEFLACLVLLAFPTGRWVGFDAILFNGRDRRRAAARADVAAPEPVAAAY